MIVLQIVKEAIAAGVDGYDAEIKKSVRKAAFGLRLTREVAMSIASKAVSIDEPGYCQLCLEWNYSKHNFLSLKHDIGESF